MNKKILIVEDDPDLLGLLVNKIQKEGYDVCQATDGQMALSEFTKNVPDLVLLDILIPLKNGLEVLEEIKTKIKSETPVIVLSNLADTKDIEMVTRLGAVDYVVKSNLSLDEIMLKVKKVFHED